MKIPILFLAFIIPLLALAEVLEGEAKNQKGEIVYLEKHTIEKDQKGLHKFIRVDYSKPDGTSFATMTSDFSNSKTVPETTFEDTRFKSRSLIRLLRDSVEFEEFKNGKSISKKNVPFNDSMVASQGFDNFIKLNSSKIDKMPIEFEFGVLESKDFYTLTGYKVQTKSPLEVEYGIKPSKWYLRLIADELRAVYDSKNMRIKSFTGRSNILDDSGNSQIVVIHYNWKDEL